MIALKHADARSVAVAIQQAFEAPLKADVERERQRQRDEARRRGNSRFDDFLLDAPAVLVDSKEVVSVSSEPLTNSLIISAGRKDIDRIRAIVTTLDVPEFEKLPTPQLIPLRSGRATERTAPLQRLFDMGSGNGRTRSARGVTIIGDNASSVLLVRADEAGFAQIRVLAEALEQEGDRASVRVRVVSLYRQPASRLAQTVQRSFGASAAQRGEALSVEADIRTNRLVIASSSELFDEIKSTLRELDGPPPTDDDVPEDGTDINAMQGMPGQELLILDVKNTSPGEIARVLNQMGVTRMQPPDRPGLVGEPIRVIPLRTRRSVAVLVSPADAAAVRRLVAIVDTEPVNGTHYGEAWCVVCS